jgi:hypothetical protein
MEYPPYVRLVEQWVARRLGDERQCRISSNDAVKVIIVDMERLGLEGVQVGSRREEVLRMCISFAVLTEEGLLTEVPWASDGGGTVPRTLKAFWSMTCAKGGTAVGGRLRNPRPNEGISWRKAKAPTARATTTTLIAP